MKATTERGDREGSVGGSVVHVPNAAFAMMPPEPMGSERPSYYYTMKTSGLSPGSSHAHARSHSRSTSQSLFSNKQTSTPISSPRAPHSVGQSYAPKLSPGAHRAGAQDTRTPSPNYFGLTVEPSLDPRDTSQLPRGNWSPPTSSVKSFAAVIPKQLPLDANPEFEAFRRQADTNRGKSGFGLSTAHFGVAAGTSHTPHASTPSALQRPRPPRWHTHGSDVSDTSQPRLLGLLGGNPRAKDGQSNKSNAETESLQDSAYGSADSKRNSEASLNPPPFFATGRQESPNPTESPFPAPERGRTSQPVPHPDTHQRLFSAQGRMGLSPLSEPERQQPRAETLPPKLESGEPAMIAPSQLKDLLKGGQDESVLLLDLRVSPQYAQSRVKGALNLCIPTTLLKRATFNLQKLQQIFQADRDQEKFASWRGSSHLVVYDASSSEKRDAVSAMNMIKKFTNEGYSGSACILRGGFNAFAAAYPELIDRTSGQAVPGFSLGSGPAAGQRPQVAPVVGGVLLPAATSNPNPFFSNIRQNQDLVDGVGQMDISLPSGLDSSGLPRWLRDAADVKDHGKRVSDKFLRIELAEQSRMRDAYTVPTPGGQTKNPQNESKVQLSGIEQGGKNRYKDILPFEHARVRLLGRPEGVCDYVNASHLQANRSHKRYIASQGPLPATFEDFWTVIWDQDVRVIVMLTAESEGGQLKCHPYWKAKDFGAIKLRVLSEKKVSLDIDKRRSDSTASPSHSQVPGGPADPSMASNQDKSTTTPSQAEAGRRRANTVTTFQSGTTGSSQTGSPEETPYVIIRKFALTHAAHPFSPIREVTQLHYPSWPDLGAPAQPSHLLALVELANVMQRATLPVDIPAAIATSSPAKISGHANPDRTGANSRRLHQSTGEQAVPLSWHDAPVSKENSRPMLVHCSAGCGRTGAFCTVDSVIDMLKRQRLRAVQRANKRIDDRGRRLPQQVNDHGRAKRQALERDVDGDISMVESVDPLSPPVNVATPPPEVSTRPEIDREKAPDDGEDIDLTWLDDDNIDLISRTVEDFRGQRLSMVQSLRQFVLCYETIIEWVWRLQERTGSSHIKGRGRSGSLAM